MPTKQHTPDPSNDIVTQILEALAAADTRIADMSERAVDRAKESAASAVAAARTSGGGADAQRVAAAILDTSKSDAKEAAELGDLHRQVLAHLAADATRISKLVVG